MAILVLDSPRLPALPYQQWLPDPVVLTVRSETETAGWRAAGVHVERFSFPYASAAAARAAFAAAAEVGASAVVALEWSDLHRAAVIADHFGLAGPARELTRTVRDLVLLRERWNASGIATVPVHAAGKPFHLYQFAGRKIADTCFRLRHRRRRRWPVVCDIAGTRGLREAARHLGGTGQERFHGMVIEELAPGGRRIASGKDARLLAEAAGLPADWPCELTVIDLPDGRTLAADLTVGVPDGADVDAYGRWARAQMSGAPR